MVKNRRSVADRSVPRGYARSQNALAAHVDEEDKTSYLIQVSGSNYKRIWLADRDCKNPQKSIRDHVDHEDKTVNESFTVNEALPVLVNGSGLYSPILSSKLPQARRFKALGKTAYGKT